MTNDPIEDPTGVYFEAESPGLSVFAITGEELKVASLVTTTIPRITTTTQAPVMYSKPLLPVVGVITFCIILFILLRYFKPAFSRVR